MYVSRMYRMILIPIKKIIPDNVRTDVQIEKNATKILQYKYSFRNSHAIKLNNGYKQYYSYPIATLL